MAYLPGDRLVSISKLPRTVEHYARRLNTQERFTDAIADHLNQALSPRGVAVVATARHLCRHMRGVRAEGTMRTQAFTGAFEADTMHRREFLSTVRQHHH
ncbi:MAG: GTP cyclohydrolase I [Acidobacteriota bacterium]|nr:GTP cyclohydrolase I [Acidobacteriota bacterium]